MKKNHGGLLLILLLLSSAGVTAELLRAEPTKEAQEQAIDSAQEKLQANFKNLRFTSFKPGPVNGLFEINTGTSIIYFHPDKQLLLMGEFYDKTGKNLTSTALEENLAAIQTQLPVDMALTLGPKDAERSLVEFTNPNCGYCKAFDRFISDPAKAKPVKRHIFFDVTPSSKSWQKALHILCANDQAVAMHNVYQGIDPVTYLDCKEGRRMLVAHAKASQIMGVRGTPSFIIDGQLILGFSAKVKNELTL